MDKKIWYWSIRHVHHRTGEKTGVSAGNAGRSGKNNLSAHQPGICLRPWYWRTRTGQKLRKHLYPGTMFQIMPETKTDY